MTIHYLEGFSEDHFRHDPAAFAPKPLAPNHISLIDGKYFLGGEEIPAERGADLFEAAVTQGEPYTFMQAIPRRPAREDAVAKDAE